MARAATSPVTTVRVDLPAETHRALKHRAVDEEKSLTQLLAELITRAAAEKPAAKK